MYTERERERFTMLHSSSCRNTHWNPHSQAAGRGRKVRETENCSKRRNEKRKYLPSQLPVPTLVNLLRKYSFLSFLHSSSPPPSCFLWACKCQTAVTTALSLSRSPSLFTRPAACCRSRGTVLPHHTLRSALHPLPE